MKRGGCCWPQQKQATKRLKESKEAFDIESVTNNEENQVGLVPLFDEVYFEFWKGRMKSYWEPLDMIFGILSILETHLSMNQEDTMKNH